MRMYDLIEKKKRGGQLAEAEIFEMIREFCAGNIPDYQMSAMLMAIYFQGMSEQETVWLTQAMASSGDMVDLSRIRGIKADKHSTGGVGDKTTLIIGPILASKGVKVAKMSGRGLGHTGGTLDKLESIPGFRTALSREEFFRTVDECGIAVIGQSGNLAPADKKLYALRDVTATVDSIPLIASSIMSKKLAAGSNAILLDVKMGSGAFMKTLEEAVTLAKAMVSIGTRAGRQCSALITNMDIPLGNAVGNALEIQEAVAALKGEGPKDLTEVCLELAANMLSMAGLGQPEHCRQLAQSAIADGSALKALAGMVSSQGGDAAYIYHPELFTPPKVIREWKAPRSGYISHMDAERIGIASVLLGAGRSRKEDDIDHAAGIVLKKKYGAYVEAGETVAVLYTSEAEKLDGAERELEKAYTFSEERPAVEPLVYARVTEQKTEYLA